MNCIGLLLGFYFDPAPLVVWRPPNSTHIQTIFFDLLEPPFQIPPLRSVANTKGVGRCHLSHEDCKDCYVKPPVPASPPAFVPLRYEPNAATFFVEIVQS